ncbi:MAG TPA: bifunctional [glutamate--ammonia ligase]-adenylyl-L-tyrosine phosphorylase/[glutamate--ammonia-ligase] adenylyltransferase, partial [Anaeromyxobacteraceae bacterium]|nr:bifunctional [glutamate--ammonia ligase]-adenylyl-L-tyrosine phosphorylase/[glutamate--ammonia-ligase] adenylyltransferase [Anaeromyxobacteraceae bacterium]
EVLRIVLRDLRRARVVEVTGELSALACACVDAAIRFHDRRLRARHGAPQGLAEREPGAGFCALAMGKLGARELNFSSDIDLLYVYGTDGTTDGPSPLTHFAYYAKLAEHVTEAIARPTEDGFVFRVDLNLRPDGHSGPIVNSVRAAELYYQSFGRGWERSALVRARPAAGDLATGDELLRLLEPFIWRRSLDLGVITEMQAMKARIDARAGAEGRDDLKLGRGGIREAEFFVNALQLLHGGKQPELRERGFLPALDRLLFAGVVPARDRDALLDAWLFLRRAEHRVQMVDGRQTHRMPPVGDRRLLARAMGFPAEQAFDEALTRHRALVSSLFSNLLGASTGQIALDPELALLAESQVETARRTELARSRGFADPERAVAALDALARRRTPFNPSGDPAAAVTLLAEVLATPDPDQALTHLADFAMALHAPESYFHLLAEHRRAARLLLSLFGTSDFLSKRFIRHPELLDMLLREDTVVRIKTPETFRRELEERLSLIEGDGVDDRLERSLGELRRFKNEEVLRIAIHDIAGGLPLASVADQLSSLAEASLDQALALAEEEARARSRMPPTPLCVIALGKLGGRELGYHSDLDLVFLYRSAGEASGAHADIARLAQRLMSFLQMPLREGVLYKIDTRLRPSGNQGALVTSAEGFARYHMGGEGSPHVTSQLWERQALLRARHVGGDAALFAEIEERVLSPVVYAPPADRAALATEVRRMRERIESEVGREAARGKNPKSGRGGLVDVEFAAQFLQLAHGWAHPAIRTPSTPAALERLHEAGILREAQHAALARGYEFLRRLELRLRIVHDYTIDHLPQAPRPLAQLARRLGYGGDNPAARLMAEYGRVTEDVRAAFEAVVS